MSSDIIVSAQGVDVYYDKSQILFGIDFELRQGQTLALLGRNGAGKSTMMKAIAGLAPPRKGTVRVLGHDVTSQPPYKIARFGLGYVPEDRQVFPEHSVEDNLLIAIKKGPNGQDDWPVERIFETFPLLVPLRGRMAGRLSGGEQQMLAIGRALMTNPRLLVLDEATEGLAPLIRLEIWRALAELKADGLSQVVIDKNIGALLGLADRHYVIEKGRIVWQGPSSELRDQPDLIHQYLGV